MTLARPFLASFEQEERLEIHGRAEPEVRIGAEAKLNMQKLFSCSVFLILSEQIQRTRDF
jgi:hypothetical protein